MIEAPIEPLHVGRGNAAVALPGLRLRAKALSLNYLRVLAHTEGAGQ